MPPYFLSFCIFLFLLENHLDIYDSFFSPFIFLIESSNDQHTSQNFVFQSLSLELQAQEVLGLPSI